MWRSKSRHGPTPSDAAGGGGEGEERETFKTAGEMGGWSGNGDFLKEAGANLRRYQIDWK